MIDYNINTSILLPTIIWDKSRRSLLLFVLPCIAVTFNFLPARYSVVFNPDESSEHPFVLMEKYSHPAETRQNLKAAVGVFKTKKHAKKYAILIEKLRDKPNECWW